MPKRRRNRQTSTPSASVEKPSAVAAPGPRTVPQPQELAALLLDPARVRPVVVVSRFPGGDLPHLDADAITLELKGIADVVTITNGPATYALEGLLPVDTHVFGSAARVYPPGLKWAKDPYNSPLRLVRSWADIGPVTAEIIADAEAVAFSGGWMTASPDIPRSAGETGLVRSIAADGSRAVVELDSGLQAFLPAESTRLEVPLHWMLHEGMRIKGAFDTTKRIFSIDAIKLPAAGEGRSDGDVVHALVRSVGSDSAELSLVPGIRTR